MPEPLGRTTQARRPSKILTVIGQCLTVVGAFAIAALLLAVVAGFITVCLVRFTGHALTVGDIQGIIGAYAFVATIAVSPVFFHGLFVCLRARTDFRTWLRLFKKSLKAHYPRLATLVAIALVAGWLVALAFDRLLALAAQGTVQAALSSGLRILELIVLLGIGATAIYFMGRGYSWGKGHVPPKSPSGNKRQLPPVRPSEPSLDRQKPAVHAAHASNATAHAANPPKPPSRALSLAFSSPTKHGGFIAPSSPTKPDGFIIPRGKNDLPHKALRATLALLLLIGTMPSVWLYTLSGAQEAYAQEPLASEAPLEQSGTPNAYTGLEQGDRGQDGVPLKEPVLEDEPEKPSDALGEVSHDRYSTTWLNRDGTYTTRIQQDPLTYTADDGTEKDINNTLVADGDGFTNADNAYSVTLPSQSGGVSFEKDGHTLYSTPLFGELRDATVKENAIYYNNVAAGIDIQYTVYGSEVKEDIILAHPSDHTQFDYRLWAEGITFVLKDGQVLGFVSGTEEDEGAVPVFAIDAPMMRDASGAASTNITLGLAENAEGTTLSIIPDAAWLAAPERAWPVTIDPSHALEGGNLTQGTIQAFDGPDSGPDMEHYTSFLYVGLEDSTLVGVPPIMYGESWSYIQINDISPYTADLPDRAILSASLSAYKYGTVRNGAGEGLPIDAKMIADPWAGDGRRTWNNRPLGGGLSYLDTQYTPAYQGWMSFNITDAFKEWKRDPATNRGIMLCPESEVQDAVSFSGTGNEFGQEALYIDLSWTVPNPVDENLPLDAPNINLRPLTYKNGVGLQNLVGLFADGLLRPAWQLDYALMEYDGDLLAPVDAGTYPQAEYEPDYPDSDLFSDELAFTLGYVELYVSNWQSKLFLGNQFDFDTIYQMVAQGTRVPDVWANPDGTVEQTPVGLSDTFIVYQFKDQDTLPYVASYYGVSREQIALDNRVGDDLAMPGNTFFIRNPNENATIPYTRPDNLTLEQKRALIYANMGRSQVSEFDMEPVNMNTGNFYLEQTDATSSEYGDEFAITRSYNALAPQSAGPFGRSWSTPFQQVITARPDGGMTYMTEDGRHLVFSATDTGWASPQGYNLTLERHDAPAPQDVTYTIRKADGSMLTFDCFGLLVSLADPRGLETVVSYDDGFRISAITTPAGHVYAVTTDAFGRITAIALPTGATLRYAYDGAGYLTSATDGDGATVRYEYDGQGQMSAWYDGLGNRVVANTYDGQGRVVKQIDASGNASTAVYGDNTTTLTDAAGIQTVYAYNDLLQTTSVARAGVVTYKAYNAEGQLISDTDGLGRTTTYTYDAAGNLATTTRPDGASQSIEYDGAARPVTVRDFDGALTQNAYDAQGDLVSRTNPDGTQVSYTYDGFGRMASLTDEAGATTTFAWDGTAALTTTDALGNPSTTYYDAMGRPVTEVDAYGTERKTIYSPGGKILGTWETGGIATSYAYDGAGRCVAVTDAQGTVSNYSYDAAGNLVSATAPEGSSAAYTYDALNNKASETDASGNTTAYSYDAWGNVTATRDAAGNTETSAYDAASRLTSTTDKAGNTTTYSYDGALDKPTRIEAPVGATSFTYDACGRVLTQENPDGTSSAFTYDARGNVSTETDESGLATTYAYDVAGRPVEQRDSAGKAEAFAYDAAGNLLSHTDALGQVTAYTYDALGRPVAQTAPGGLTTQFTYDAQGNTTRVVRPDNSELSFTYDAAGNLTSSADGAGATTRYGYTALGGLAAVTDGAGAVTTYSYDGDQRLLSTKGPLSETLSYTYDKLGRPVAVTDPRNNTSTLAWDALGQAIKATAPDGSATLSEYDSAGHVTRTEDAAGLVAEYEYDARGNLIHQRDNAGFDATFAYDASNRPTRQTDALGRAATYAYDAWGNLTASTDFNGDSTSYTYDLLGRVTQMKKSSGEEEGYAYDEAGNLVCTTDELGRTTTYAYDALGQAVSMTDAAGQVWHYAYDAAGNLVSTTDPEGVTTTTDYDAVGRPLTATDGRGNATRYTWDLSGNLVAQATPDGATTEYAYDAAGNPVMTKDPLGYISSFEYDALGRLTKTTSPLGAVNAYAYDAHGNLVSETDALGNTTTHAYSLSDLRTSTTLPNGLVQTYAYDAAGRITEAADSTGLAMSFAYDAAGNVTSQTEQPTDATTAFTYDTAHRLTSATDALGAKTTYAYDAAGNLVSSTLPNGSSYSYAYDALDRMVEGTHSATLPVGFTYDSSGNVLQTVQGDKVQAFGYDGAGNLTSSTDALGKSSSTAYNAVNLPVSSTDRNGATSAYAYDAVGNLVSATDALGNTRTYTYDAHRDVTSATDALGNTTRYGWDLAGNLTKVTDPLGRIGAYTYDAQGNVTSTTISASPGTPLYGATAFEQAQGAAQAKEYKTTYEYDLHGNLTKTTSPAGEVESFQYDVASRLTSFTSPSGKATSYDYDKLGQLLEKSYSSDEGTVAYAYDTSGNRLSMDDPAGTSSYTYNEAGQLSSYTQPDGRSLAYAYDAYGRLAQVTYPDGRQVAYDYDLDDNIATVHDSVIGDTAYTYDTEGNVLSCERPDGTFTRYAYDAAGQLTLLENLKGTALLSSFAYTYDKEGRIATEEAYQAPAPGGEAVSYKRAYTYDGAGELSGYTEDEGGKTSITTYSWDLRGNRVATTTEDGGGSHVVTSSYDEAGRLVRQSDSKTGEEVAFAYDGDGNLVSKTSSVSGQASVATTYTYDAEDRLKAVREGGALLMAATYDGDGNRLFQVHRTVTALDTDETVPDAQGAPGAAPALDPLDAIGLAAQSFTSWEGDAPATYFYQDRVYDHTFEDNAFGYGFGLFLSVFATAPDMAFAPLAQKGFDEAFARFLDAYSLAYRFDEAGTFSTGDIDALHAAGLTDADVADVTRPEAADQPDGGDAPTAAGVPNSPAPVLVPTNPGTDTRYDYELTYYVNDISYSDAQVASEYGKRGELKADYTYGVDRIAATTSDGTVESYLYDGRGSVAQVYATPGAVAEGPGASFPDYPIAPAAGSAAVPATPSAAGMAPTPTAASLGSLPGGIASSLRYDPFGGITSGADPNALAFAYNAEERNPVTGLDYLRARYYDPATASFLTKDTETGSPASLNSQNRYAYAEADPVGNADPSGHAITGNPYERQMEGMGGINEIYNLYVGKTLQNSYAQASSAFYSRLNYAYGVDYRSIAAINSISQIPQAVADYYINQGAAMARAVGQSWGCSPGALANAAIGSFAADVNATKDSVNSQIAAVKSNKYYQYQQYQAYLAYLAYQARMAAAAETLGAYVEGIRARLGLSESLSVDFILEHFGNPIEMQDMGILDTLRNIGDGSSIWSDSVDAIVRGGLMAKGLELLPEVKTFLRGAGIPGYIGSAIDISINAYENFKGGGDFGTNFWNTVYDSAWDIEMAALTFVYPPFGSAASVILGVADIATGGALSQGNNDLIRYATSEEYLSTFPMSPKSPLSPQIFGM